MKPRCITKQDKQTSSARFWDKTYTINQQLSIKCINVTMDLFKTVSQNFMEWQVYLALVGLFYLMKILLALIIDFKVFLKTYILPSIGQHNTDFVGKYGKWGVVTGCTQGIGKAYVDELAKRGMNIVLISRNRDKLERLSEEIKTSYRGDVKRYVYIGNTINLHLVYI